MPQIMQFMLQLYKKKGEFMNICVVSTFDGTTDDFMEIFNWAKDKASAFATDFEVGVIKRARSLQWEMLLIWKNFKK